MDIESIIPGASDHIDGVLSAVMSKRVTPGPDNSSGEVPCASTMDTQDIIIPDASDHIDELLRSAMSKRVTPDTDNTSVASRRTTAGRKKAQIFTWTSPSGDSVPLQHREISIVDTQEKYSFTMEFLEEYLQQRQNHQGKDWVHAEVVNKWASKYGIPPLVSNEVRRKHPNLSEADLEPLLMLGLGEKLTKFFNNRVNGKVVKAKASAIVPMEVSGRARSRRELFIDTIREDVLKRAHTEFDAQKAAHEKGEGPAPARILNIMNELSTKEWDKLTHEERDSYIEEAREQKGQRQQIKDGKPVDSSAISDNLLPIFQAFFANLQESLPDWTFHMQAAGPKSDGKTHSFTAGYPPKGEISFKAWLGSEFEGRIGGKWADYATYLKKRQEAKAKGNEQTSTPAASTPDAPAPDAPAPAAPAPAPAAPATTTATPSATTADLAPLDFQLTDDSVHEVLSKYIGALWDERFRGGTDPMAFVWVAVFKTPHLYLAPGSVPDGIIFAEDGTLDRQQLYEFYGHLYNGQEPSGEPTFAFLPANQIRKNLNTAKKLRPSDLEAGKDMVIGNGSLDTASCQVEGDQVPSNRDAQDGVEGLETSASQRHCTISDAGKDSETHESSSISAPEVKPPARRGQPKKVQTNEQSQPRVGVSTRSQGNKPAAPGSSVVDGNGSRSSARLKSATKDTSNIEGGKDKPTPQAKPTGRGRK
ncbi:hypothetical protein BOTBODRAFT_173168 [Botryobasidium botryosum FD-172 SS1]|uniref:Uncharacterized protein n=1 Tax=Botryobasidium botryosum (strain FD-172 SS1) TaxID=930990 RepID=A0A067MNG8_BOTB1|nr:hypothetical protein BOTBODRAFT_173168 [Botryobasidium botryosum FD-172 SS1]